MNKFKKLIKETLTIVTISVLVFVAGFAYFEPSVIWSATDEHTVKQTVTAELSFVATPADVVMDTSLAGITGGTSNGQTQFRVLSNNTTGFNVTINTDSNNGMEGEGTAGIIPILSEGTPYTPDYTFTSGTVAANTAAFAYSVNASTTGEIVAAFRNDTAACNTGATETDANCWIGATTTARTIINRSTATAASGATSTLFYRVIINSSPSPAIPEDTYTSTTTLTATNN